MLAGKLLRLSGGIAVLGIIFATSLAAQPAAAAALTWTGSAGAAWSTSSTNWSTVGVGTPWDSTNGPSYVADFNTASATPSVSGNLVNANGIQFDNTATVSGGTINLVTAGGSPFATPTITANAAATISSILSGSASMIMTGSGTLTLSGANVFTGGATINAGLIVAGNNAAFGASSGTLTLSGGSITTSGKPTISNPIYVTSGSTTNVYGYSGGNNYPILTGAITGNGTILNYNASGGLGNAFINGDMSQFAGTISYLNSGSSDNFQFNGGGGLNASGSNAHFVSNGSTTGGGAMYVIETAGVTFQMGDLSGSGGIISTVAAGTLQIGALNTNTTYSGVIAAGSGISLNKVGSGSLTLAGANKYTGATTLTAGTLNAGSAQNGSTSGPFGASPAISFLGGTLQYSAANQFDYSTGFSTAAGQAFNIDTNGQSVSYATALTSSGGTLNKYGAGTLALGGANGYDGPTNVIGGNLAVNGSLLASSTVSVAGGATLSGSGSVSAVTVAAHGTIQGGADTTGSESLSLASLTFNGVGNLSGALGTATPIIVSGAVATAGSNTVDISVNNTPASPGTYHYLQYGSLPSPEGLAAFQIYPPTRSLSLVGTDAGYVDINYNPTNYPIWTGANGSAFVGGNNWKLSSNGSPTDFLASDTCVLDDSATGSTAIIVNTSVMPASLTFSNTTKNYSLTNTGTGTIAGGSLNMNGAGLLTIAGNNSFSVANLNGGTVSVGTIANSGVPQPLGAGGAINFNGGTLDYSGPSASTNSALTINGIGGAIQVDNPAATLSLSMAPSGTGALTKAGPGGLSLPSGTYPQAIAVNGGTLSLGSGEIDGALSGPSSSVLVLNNGSTTLNLGSGPGDTTANTFAGTTYVNGYHIVLNKAADTPAIGGNIVFLTGAWPYHDMYPVSDNVFAAGTVLNFSTTNNTLYEFHLNGTNQTLAGINCSNGNAIFENAGYDGGNDNGIAAATLTLNGTGFYSYNASLRDQNNGGGNGALGLVMQGPGTQVLVGGGIGGTTGGITSNGGYSGTTEISGGVLRFNLTNALPGGAITLDGGVLELQSPNSLTLPFGSYSGAIQLTGGTTGFSAYGAPVTVTLNSDPFTALQWGVSTGFSPAALVLNAPTANNTLTFQNPIDLNGAQQTIVVGASTAVLSGVVSDSTNTVGGLTKAGSGALLLANANTYTGPTNVNAGTLYVGASGSLSLTSTVTVAAGATFGGQAAAGAVGFVNVNPGGGIEGGQSGAGSLTLTALAYSGSGSVLETPAAGAYVPLIVSASNGLTANGGADSVLINLAGSSLGNGTYHLIEFTGSVQGSGTAAFQIGSSDKSARTVYKLVDDAVDGYLNLDVTTDSVIWSGSASNSWDTVTRVGTTNWKLQSSGSQTNFLTNDQVIFNDTAATGNVAINAGDVNPNSVAFNNNSLKYTLSGSNGITGATALTMSGSGLLTISNTNSFTGAVNMNGGTIAVGALTNSGTAGPLGAGSAVEFNGGTLEYTTPGGAATTDRTLTFNPGGGAISVDDPAASLTLTGVMSGSGALTKSGAGLLMLASAANTGYNGPMTVSRGTLDFNNSNSVGTASAVTLGDAHTGANAVTMLVDSAITAPVTLANIYTSSYGTAQTIVLNGGAGLGGNDQDLYAVLNLSGTVPLTIQATNTGGHGTAQDWSGQIIGTGVPAGSTALILDGSINNLRLTWANGNGTLPANNFTGDVLIKGTVTTQGVTYLGAGNASYQNLGFLNNNVTVSSGATWNIVWGGETVQGLNGPGNIFLNCQNALNNIGLTVGNNDASGTFSGAISGGFGLDKTGSGTQILTGASVGGIPTATSSFSGGVTVDNGTLVVAAVASGNNTVLGNASNSQTITVNAGGTLLFIAPNALGTAFNSTNVPTLNINGGTVTNAEPGNGFPVGLVNNALNNVNLTNGVLTATTGQHGGYAAWNINGTIYSSGNSLISTNDPVYGTVMLSSSGGQGGIGVTTINVADTQLTISAPLVQDNVDGDVSGLSLTSDSGTGVLVLSGTNTYMGGTTVNSGTLIAAIPQAIADGTNLYVGDPGSLSLFGTAVSANGGLAAASPAVAPVPEPGTLAMVAALLGGAAFYRRIRRS